LPVQENNTPKVIGHLVDISPIGFMMESKIPIQTELIYALRLNFPEAIAGKTSIELCARGVWYQSDSIQPFSYDVGFETSEIAPDDIDIFKSITHKYGSVQFVTILEGSNLIDPTLPLIELHRHLDGNVRLETILDLGKKHALPLPAWDVEGLRPHVQVTDPQPGVMAFITKFQWLVGVMVDYDAIHRIAYENVEDACRDGIDYIELRFSPWFMAEAHKMDPAGVVEAVAAGVKAGQQEFGVKANLIGILSRTYGPDIAEKELEALLSQREHIVALDLAGDEANFPAALFKEHFRRARQAGWHITVHAGESAGPESIWEALRGLGAERIGHGLRAIEDAGLMDVLVEDRIGVETCLTSNVQTSCVADYRDHPLRSFLEAGILATINTDDTSISGINLPYEYQVAAVKAGLTDMQIRQAQVNALEVAFLTEAEKQALIKKRIKS
jgi:adenosine deaminase